MDDGTTCGDLSSYASALESNSPECGSIRLAESVCCFQSMSPTASPSNDPTVTLTKSLLTTLMANPMGDPTTTPSAQPSSSPSSSPTLSSMPLAAPIPYTRSPRVDARYALWDKLPEEMAAAVAVRYYNQSTWENYGTNLVEDMHHAVLTREEKAAALILGYADPELWDCWRNHYENYKWINLGVEYVQARQWWEALGWDITRGTSTRNRPRATGWTGTIRAERRREVRRVTALLLPQDVGLIRIPLGGASNGEAGLPLHGLVRCL
jgi:hypothetical protein